MLKNVTINESRLIIEKIILRQLDTSAENKNTLLGLIKPYPGNKWAALLAIAPFVDGSESPMRESIRSLLLFGYEIKNPKSAFARKILNSTIETSYERMKWFYELKQSNSLSRAVMYALQEAEMTIRERKNIAVGEAKTTKEYYLAQYKSSLEESIVGGSPDEISIIETICSLQTPTPGFWCL